LPMTAMSSRAAAPAPNHKVAAVAVCRMSAGVRPRPAVKPRVSTAALLPMTAMSSRAAALAPNHKAAAVAVCRTSAGVRLRPAVNRWGSIAARSRTIAALKHPVERATRPIPATPRPRVSATVCRRRPARAAAVHSSMSAA
jgi:hypothetical protein